MPDKTDSRKESENVKAKKIIIVSCGDITDVMIDGKLYEGVMAVNFSHNGGEINEFRLTGDPVPTVDNDPVHRAGFMRKIAEFSKVPESHLQESDEIVEEIDNLIKRLSADIAHKIVEKTNALAEPMSTRAQMQTDHIQRECGKNAFN